VAATCDALSITSLVARKLLGASFSLVRKRAGKLLLHLHNLRIKWFLSTSISCQHFPTIVACSK